MSNTTLTNMLSFRLPGHEQRELYFDSPALNFPKTLKITLLQFHGIHGHFLEFPKGPGPQYLYGRALRMLNDDSEKYPR